MKKDYITLRILLFCLSLFCVVAVNAQPTFQWAKQMGGNSTDRGYAIATDAFGNVYTTGCFSGLVDFDPGTGTYTLATSSSEYDVFITKFDPSGSFVWAKQITGGSAGGFGYGISIDGMGNVNVTGYFVGSGDFDPGIGVANLTSQAFSQDIFVLKLDGSGNFMWAKSMGGNGNDQGLSIATNSLGEVFTTGYFNGTGDFDPGSGTYTMSTSPSSQNAFISKLSASGNFVWAKQLSSLNTITNQQASAITIDGMGNLIIGGTFNGQTDFDPSASTFSISAINGDAFALKLNGSGNFIWAKSLGGASAGVEFKSLATDAANNIYGTGGFDNTVDFDPSAASFTLTAASNSPQDVFIVKLDASGNFSWAKGIGGNGANSDIGNSIAVSPAGEVYVTGEFCNTVDFDPSASTYTLSMLGTGAFVLKLSTSGNFIWAAGFGNGDTSGDGIAISPSSEIYSTGTFNTVVDFDPSAAVNTMTATTYDIFVHKLGQSICPTFSVNSTTSSYTLMCALNSLTLNAVNTSSFSGVTYTWAAPSSATATGSSYTLSAGGIYTVNASVASNTCIVTQLVSIIQSTGNVNFNINTDGSVCNNNGTASVVVTSGTAPYTYTWSAGGNSTNVSSLAPGNYTVKVTDANLCSLTQSFSIINAAPAFSSVPICFVTVDSLSQHNVITWDKTAFPNADTFYVYRETGTNLYQLIRKQPYSGFSQFVDTVKTLYFPNTGNPNVGTYRYKMKIKDNCSNYSEFSPYHNTLFMVNNNGTFSWTQLYQIEGDPNPVLAYILERDNLSNNNWAAVGSVAGTQQFIIDPNYTTYQATASWRVKTQWSISCLPSKSTSTLTASYSNRVTNNNVGIKANTIEQYLSIYPNPTNGKVNIDLKNTKSSLKIINIEIHSITGQKIYTSSEEISVNSQIDLSGNASGIYFITLRTENKVLKGKLVIDK